MTCHWEIKENIWFPPIRIGATMTDIGHKIIMFGGYSKSALNDIY